MRIYFPILLLIALINACGDNKQKSIGELELKMNQIAEQYVKLVLEIGLYKPDYIDAYFGPVEWKPEQSSKKEIDSTLISLLNEKTDALLNDLESLKDYQATDIETIRYRFL